MIKTLNIETEKSEQTLRLRSLNKQCLFRLLCLNIKIFSFVQNSLSHEQDLLLFVQTSLPQY